jgi:hypothetical protein
MEEKTDKADKEADQALPAWQIQLLCELRRQEREARLKWKSTLFQTQAVFLSICVPLTLGQVPKGSLRNLLLAGCLGAAVSLLVGSRAIAQEADLARRLAVRNTPSNGQRPQGVYTFEQPTRLELLTTSIFATSSFLSILYLLGAIVYLLFA